MLTPTEKFLAKVIHNTLGTYPSQKDAYECGRRATAVDIARTYASVMPDKEDARKFLEACGL